MTTSKIFGGVKYLKLITVLNVNENKPILIILLKINAIIYPIDAKRPVFTLFLNKP